MEKAADAMSDYQLSDGKPGLYIALEGKHSAEQGNALRQILISNRQAKIISATDADKDGEKYAVFVHSIRPDAVRVRPTSHEHKAQKYESWHDVLTDTPMQPQQAPRPQQASVNRRWPPSHPYPQCYPR